MGDQSFYRVVRFVEKPDAETAARYLESKNYYWNSGIFVWKNKTIQESIELYMPELWDGLSRINTSLGGSSEKTVLRKEFDHFKRISIDYGVLEKSPKVAVVPATFVWDDLGTWSALTRVCPLDENGNLLIGQQVGKDTSGCVIYAQDHLIATFGVKDLVIVQANKRLLVCHKDKAPFLKEIVGSLPVE